MAPEADAVASMRTNLLVPSSSSLATTAAGALTLDFTSSIPQPVTASTRRATAAAATTTLGATSPPHHVRLVVVRSGMAPSVEATVTAEVAAVLLSGVERPQDVRDTDVAIRRHELRLGLEPGTVRLISEVGSAIALRALPRILAAVDRHAAVALNTDAFATDLGLSGLPQSHAAIFDHAMAEVSITARAARISWLLLAPALDAGARSALATRAHAHGASGVYITAEPEAHGFNSLFTR